MGAIDLVVQIEAPPSVASGLQRIGRGGHTINAAERRRHLPEVPRRPGGVRGGREGDARGAVEATRYPRNPLDIVAQQIVAMVAMDTWDVDELFHAVRRAAPFAELSRTIFDGVLDMLSGRYPSDEFAELRPRVTWDRLKDTIDRARRRQARGDRQRRHDSRPRPLRRVPPRATRPGSARVGELDEEMVFESRVGETFVLGASSWRIEEITHDRVLVSPAPGRAGQDAVLEGGPRRPSARARAANRRADARPAADAAGRGHPAADARPRPRRARRREPAALPRAIRWPPRRASPTPARSSIERVRDELGDWRVCVLSPRGGRIHAPWAMAVVGEDPRGDRRRRRDAVGRRRVRGQVSRDGRAARSAAAAAGVRTKSQALVVRQLGGDGALRGEVPRERGALAAAAEAPARHARTPLWQQRKRAADLLAVASRYGSFPVLLETYRECLRDFFDMPALVEHAAPTSQPEDPRRHGRFRDAVAVCGVAALQLRRQLHLRRRRAAGRAARAGAGGRPGAAARAARRRRAARAARRRRDGGRSSASCSGSTRVPRAKRRRACTTCCSASAI